MSTATATQTPDRSEDQRLASLRYANQIRSLRSSLKVSIKAGDTRAPALILDPPDYALTMKVYAVLMAQRSWGRVKVDRLIRRCEVSPSKTLGGLSDRQRYELVRALLDGGS